MIEPNCSNVMIITAIFRVSEILGFFITATALSVPVLLGPGRRGGSTAAAAGGEAPEPPEPGKVNYHTVMFLSFRTDSSGQTVQTQIRLIKVYTVCNSLCIFWMETPSCSTFKVITANFRVSEILGFLRQYIYDSGMRKMCERFDGLQSKVWKAIWASSWDYGTFRSP